MNTPPLHVTFAVSERLDGHDVVLPAGLAEELNPLHSSLHSLCVEISSLHLTKSARVINNETIVSRETESMIIDPDRVHMPLIKSTGKSNRFCLEKGQGHSGELLGHKS